MATNPKVLVIFDSEDLKGWWETLPDAWKSVLAGGAKVDLNPSKEALAKVTNIDSINFAGNPAIQDLRPLQQLQKLRIIIANNTAVSDLSPIQDHHDIRRLDISNTRVTDLSTPGRFDKIVEIRADGLQLQSIDPLGSIVTLQKVYVDGTTIGDDQVRDFLQKRPDCLVIYKTAALEGWWNDLSPEWKEIFVTQTPINPTARREDLHKLAERTALQFKDVPVSDLSPLHVFVRLRELDFSGTSVSDVTPLSTIESLRSLHVTKSPLRDLVPLSNLTMLTDLDISNTPVEDLRPLGALENLRTLNCSGTQIKSIDALEYLPDLESLDCSNTGVKKISALLALPIKILKCYNTRISAKTVDKFKQAKPECNVIFY